MDPHEYRRRVERELAQESLGDAGAAADDVPTLIARARSRTAEPSERARALALASRADAGDEALLTAALEILANESEPVLVRRAAFDSLQLASLTARSFGARRAEFLATLRAIVETSHEDLRRRALTVLARERDADAQRRLREGLEDPSRALVPPEVAIPLLGYDPESGAPAAVRRIAESDANLPARVEAVRLLATDAASQSFVEDIARDRSEPAVLRQEATSALHANHPATARRIARDLLFTEGEDAEVLATGLVALTLDSGPHEEAAAPADAGPLRDRVNELARTTTSDDLRKSAQAFLSKRP